MIKRYQFRKILTEVSILSSLIEKNIGGLYAKQIFN